MRTVLVGAVISLLMVLAAGPARAEPVAVRFSEGVTRGFPVLRSIKGEILAQGELIQVARGDVVESRLIFRFRDGSLYDEQVVFSQRDVFQLQSYQIVQRGRSFPETLEARVDRVTERYEVRYRADEESAPETLSGDFTLPDDVYNGLLSTLMKNLPAGGSATVQIVAFTPKPRLVKMLLTPAAEDPVQVNHAALIATRFLVRPQLGLLASILLVDVPDLKCWIIGGEAPAFIRFEGPLYFMGPIWRIDWS
jgi:hypothetical protein